MLDEILERIGNHKGPVTVSELAGELGIEPGALEGMLAFLERKGKLDVYRPGSCRTQGSPTCGSCVFSGCCELRRKND